MRYGVLLLSERVAPRWILADRLLLASCRRGRLVATREVSLQENGWPDLLALVREHRVDSLVCGGVPRELKTALQLGGLEVIDNVAATADETLEALATGVLRPDFGFGDSSNAVSSNALDSNLHPSATLDCLTCPTRICLFGQPCGLLLTEPDAPLTAKDQRVLDAAMDVNLEEGRVLCRIAELVYFCLEMDYHRIGVAFCIDLIEQTEVLVQLLRRFFKVHPVCCKVGGSPLDEPAGGPSPRTGSRHVACNPAGQAAFLNDLKTDLNVVVGLCMGVDCLFVKASEAPITSLFVKDKSLANNPIAAIYSEYHLNEVSRVPATNRPTPANGVQQ